ncbi:methyltransferase FkbM family [Chthoniobacter flavus Ellin428]|uniref:Methyltransferase FkbM family n=1 Tax=Chthoniobacter flavus Ellin428 TaxID=497964 RepID=B4D651_9BACT|nr:FkbM family methyltransferase [Chthoniobacter flavus]EDY17960.1 methyltransferase FkbM family [Chthoniobacter flavus Ellin428]TCO81604.1 FkbM family methyltransferase [Chthoniobacter flavus]
METVLDLASRNHLKARIQAVLALSEQLTAPLIYADVGALWGVDSPLLKMLRDQQRMKIIGFEIDPAECERLKAISPNDTYLAFGVGDVDAMRPFYVTAFAANSSFLEPDLDALAGLPHRDIFRVVSTGTAPMRRFDTLIATGTVPVPTFLKIDAQGFEYNVLRGFGAELQNVLGIRLETQLRSLYKGQALFHDIYELLKSNGFMLRDVRITYPFEYEVVELEVFFSRDPRHVAGGNSSRPLRIWELIHDIPSGRTIGLENGRVNWLTLPI